MSEENKEERTEKPFRDLPAEKDVTGGRRAVAGDMKGGGDTKGGGATKGGGGTIDPPQGPPVT